MKIKHIKTRLKTKGRFRKTFNRVRGNKKSKTMKKINKLAILFMAMIISVTVFTSCNDEEEKYSSIGSSNDIYSSIDGDYVLMKNNKQIAFKVIANRIILSKHETTLKVSDQIIYVDSAYPYTDRGLADARRRVDVLKDRYGMPCADYYLCYNKEKEEFQYLVLYSTTGPCDWYDNI